jgi:hypothetical protein
LELRRKNEISGDPGAFRLLATTGVKLGGELFSAKSHADCGRSVKSGVLPNAPS